MPDSAAREAVEADVVTWNIHLLLPRCSHSLSSCPRRHRETSSVQWTQTLTYCNPSVDQEQRTNCGGRQSRTCTANSMNVNAYSSISISISMRTWAWTRRHPHPCGSTGPPRPPPPSVEVRWLRCNRQDIRCRCNRGLGGIRTSAPSPPRSMLRLRLTEWPHQTKPSLYSPRKMDSVVVQPPWDWDCVFPGEDPCLGHVLLLCNRACTHCTDTFRLRRRLRPVSGEVPALMLRSVSGVLFLLVGD